MDVATLLLCVSFLGTDPAIEPAHARNAVYRSLLDGETLLDGLRTALPAPVFHDGQDAQEQRAALKSIVKSEDALKEFLRDSVSSPFVLKVRDEPNEGGGVIRRADLWFAVRADLDAIDPVEVLGPAGDSKTVEAGNMEFRSRVLDNAELTSRSIEVGKEDKDRIERYIHLAGRLLDRISVEATDQTIATRSGESWVIASRTDRRFDEDKTFPNRWYPIVRRSGRDEPGKLQRYAGGASYARIVALHEPVGVLVVEAHFAFLEPHAWFDGAPILRSKISLVTQDQIRRLRRELAKKSEPSRR
jgi:hypothetical protein